MESVWMAKKEVGTWKAREAIKTQRGRRGSGQFRNIDSDNYLGSHNSCQRGSFVDCSRATPDESLNDELPCESNKVHTVGESRADVPSESQEWTASAVHQWTMCFATEACGNSVETFYLVDKRERTRDHGFSVRLFPTSVFQYSENLKKSCRYFPSEFICCLNHGAMNRNHSIHFIEYKTFMKIEFTLWILKIRW